MASCDDTSMFIGREHELELLNRRYDSDTFQFVPVYGRRRVGKTALLREFCKRKDCVFFTPVEGALDYNMSSLASAIVGAKVNADMDSVLGMIRERAAKERFLLVIDEYPRIIKKAPEFQDRLQELIDEIHDDSKLFLILCGSSIGIMEHQVLGCKSPLYGRRTGSLELKPLDFWTSMRFLEGFETKDALRIYGMVGGIPMYLRLFDAKKSIRDNIADLFFEEDSFFFNEHTLTLMEEFENPATYYLVIEAVASGHSKTSEVASYARLDQPIAAIHLKTLTDIGIISKVRPVDNPDGKKTRYLVSDPFMRFQLGRVLPARMGLYEPQEAAEKVLKLLDGDMGVVFEGICTEYLLRRFGGIPGKWWGNDPSTKTSEEIDIVITTPPGEGIFAECKFTSKPVGRDVLDTLIRRSSLVKGYQRRTYAIFSKSGFEGIVPREDVLLFTLDDVMMRPER